MATQGDTGEVGAELRLRFVLLDDMLDRVRHALVAGLTTGPTLCGIAEPRGGWPRLQGFTSMADRIGCDACRALADEIIAASLITA